MKRKKRIVHRFQPNRKIWKPTIIGQNYSADIKNKPMSQPARFVSKLIDFFYSICTDFLRIKDPRKYIQELPAIKTIAMSLN